MFDSTIAKPKTPKMMILQDGRAMYWSEVTTARDGSLIILRSTCLNPLPSQSTSTTLDCSLLPEIVTTAMLDARTRRRL